VGKWAVGLSRLKHLRRFGIMFEKVAPAGGRLFFDDSDECF
jgi:hypothetical protein